MEVSVIGTDILRIYFRDTHIQNILKISIPRSLNPVLAPGIKIAYLVMPKPLIEKWSLKLPFYNCLASRAEQFAVAELIKDGHAIKYVNSLRKIYKEKQDILISHTKEYMTKNIDHCVITLYTLTLVCYYVYKSHI